MTYEQAVEHLNAKRPLLSAETNEALDAVIAEGERGFTVEAKVSDEVAKWLIEKYDCVTCMRQGCRHKDMSVLRVNCPLHKWSAV